MRAAWYERPGAARDVLEIGELPDPAPGAGEVLVRVHASGVNPTDTKGRTRPLQPPRRIIPHQDGAGVVEAVGDGVDPARVGERVWLYFAQWQRDHGTAAELIALPAELAVPLPDGTTFAEGAALGIPAMTAHRCLFADGPIEGRTVLVTGGAGAVGWYACALARRAGAHVIATVSSDAKAELARRAGAHDVVDYRTEEVVGRLGENSVDRVVDVAFGANLPTTLRVLRPGGVVATYSSDAVPDPRLPFGPLQRKNALIRFVLIYLVDRPALDAAIADITAADLPHNVLEPLPLERIADAHELVERGAGGKVIVEP
jgi:NADPH2:quinone reductase